MRGYISSLSFGLLASVCFAAAEAVAEAPKERKSIVPAKYADKYKKGGGDELAKLIDKLCTVTTGEGAEAKTEFSFDKFFDLAAKNGVDAAQVDKYRAVIASDSQGKQGRVRMTVGNMLRAKVRHNAGAVVDLDGNTHQVTVAKPAVSGAAAKAQEGELQGAAAEAAKTTAADPAQEPDTETLTNSGETVEEDGTADTDDE